MLPRGLLKEHSQFFAVILRGFDALAVIIAGLAAYYSRFHNFQLPTRYAVALGTAAVFVIIIFQFFRIYESIRAKSAWQHLITLIEAIGAVLICLAGLAFLTKTGETFSRAWFISWAVYSTVALVIFRCALLILLRLMRARGWNEKRVLIIGAGKLGTKLAETMQQAVWTGFRVLVIYDDYPEGRPKTISGIPVQKTPDDLSLQISGYQGELDEIWIALPLHAEKRVKELLYDLRHHTITVRFVLDVFGLGLFKHTISDVDGFPMLNLNSSPMVGVNRLLKAIEDRLFATIILVLISPILLLIAIGIKCSSKGPVFFKQLRHGWDGRVIKVYKFRTMTVHKEAKGKVTQATTNDARITPFGRLLRKTSLDELPQFFNVLQGRMSIVGPRPHALVHNEFYKDSIHAYMQRHKVKPGITGWAQVNGWRGETDTLEKMQKRVDYDLYYIENWSLLFDLKIIFLTVFRGFMNKNAY